MGLKDGRLIVGATLLSLVGCQAQEPPSYRGEPLAELHGTIQSVAASAPPSSLVAGLIWALYSSSGSATASACGQVPNTNLPNPVELPIVGSFPASFKLDIYTPPPSAALSNGYAAAQVVVFDKATKQLWGTPNPATTLIYVTSSFNPDGVNVDPGIPRQDEWLAQPHPPGFYLLQQIKDSIEETGGAIGSSPVKVDWDAPDGLSTELAIALAPPTPPTATNCPGTHQGSRVDGPRP